MMHGKYVLISGSASRNCPDQKLDAAIRFVESFTAEVLNRGGGIVVLAGGEDSARNAEGTPLIFDWVALRGVERFAERTMETPRPYAQIVMSDQAPESKIDDANLRLLANLEQRNAVERTHIRREVYTGGEYRTVMTEVADAMVAVGGGKGTYSTGISMTELGKPVLPLDLDIGAITEDGAGAIALHREMMSDTDRFFPNTYSQINNSIGMISLNRGLAEPEAVALTAVEMLSKELGANQPEPAQTIRSKRPFSQAGRVLKELPLVAAAVKIVEFLRNLIPFAHP